MIENANRKKKGLVKPKIVAEIFNVHRNTVINWAKSGKIPAVIVGGAYRFCLEDIQEAVPNLPSALLN